MDVYDDPDESASWDMDDEELDDLATCAECGEEVYAGGDRCPNCGYWMVQGDGYDKPGVRRLHRNTKLVGWFLLIVFGILLFTGLIVSLMR